MAKIQVNIAGLNRFLSLSVQPFLLRKAQEIADEARVLAPVGTGELRNSITVERGPKFSAVVRVRADYAGFVHQGTGPGHIPNPQPAYFPRVRKRGIIVWADSKGLNPYAVAHGISQKGTQANPFLEEAIQKILGRNNFRWIKKDITQG